MFDLINNLLNTVKEIKSFEFLFSLFLFLIIPFIKKIIRFTLKKLPKLQNKLIVKNLNDLIKPIKYYIGLLAFGLWISSFPNQLIPDLFYSFKEKVFTIAQAAFLCYCLSIIIVNFENAYKLKDNSYKIKIDDMIVSGISKLLKAILVTSFLIVVMKSFNVDLSAIFAIGGIGGIAIGFSSQEVLANFISGIMLYIEKPFKVGDWIRSPDKEIEGVVKAIGLRRTEILTFDKRPLLVPNRDFNNIAIENPSLMKNRQIKQTIGLRYQDANKIFNIIKKIKSYILQHKAIDKKQVVLTHFNEFGDSSLNIEIMFYTITTDWIEHLDIKQEVLLMILKIIHDNNADVAFPVKEIIIKNSK